LRPFYYNLMKLGSLLDRLDVEAVVETYHSEIEQVKLAGVDHMATTSVFVLRVLIYCPLINLFF
jgi:hypothetical protein